MHFHPYASNLDCIYEAKLLRIASKRDKSSIFIIKHCFSAKSANYCDFQNRDIYLSKLLLFKKTPDLAFSDIVLKHIQR